MATKNNASTAITWRPEVCDDWPNDQYGNPCGPWLHGPIPHDCALGCTLNCASKHGRTEVGSWDRREHYEEPGSGRSTDV